MPNFDPKQLQTELKALPDRLKKAFKVVINARTTLALFLMFAIGFGSQLAFAPTRLPPLGGFGLVSVGLPPLNLGEAGRIAAEAGAAAQRQGGGDRLAEWLAAHAGIKPALNGIGLGASAVIFVILALYQSRQPYHLRRSGLSKE